MAIATTDDVAAQLNIVHALDSDETAFIASKLDAAQNHIERLLGYRIADKFEGNAQDPYPPALVEAVCQLSAYWFDHREPAVLGEEAAELPFMVREIVTEYREFTF